MKIKKTFSVILMIFLTTIVLNIASFLFSETRGPFVTSDPEKVFLTSLVQAGLIAALLGVTVWMMMIWDSGDKIPPALMLILGILGICPFIVHLADPLLSYHVCSGIPFIPYNTASDASHSISTFLTYYSSGLLAFLYIGFGVAGFFTKKKTA